MTMSIDSETQIDAALTEIIRVYGSPHSVDKRQFARISLHSIIASALQAERDAERERCAKIADAYSEDYDKALYLYGAADLDSGRGRQEGHIKAGKEIATSIREAK